MSAATFHGRYAAAFATFVAEPSERSLRAAYELGRDAVKAELSILEIAGAHHEALASALDSAPGENTAAICAAAGDFLVESLAAFEMIQRGWSEARRAAFTERRNARMMRQLSTLLADDALAAGEVESLEEVLQLVAEQAREMTDAGSASIFVFGREESPAAIAAHSESDGDDTWSEVLQPPATAPSESGRQRDAILEEPVRTPLQSLDGSVLGWIEVTDKQGGDFSPADRAVLTQVAQMTAAAVERALAYT